MVRASHVGDQKVVGNLETQNFLSKNSAKNIIIQIRLFKKFKHIIACSRILTLHLNGGGNLSATEPQAM